MRARVHILGAFGIPVSLFLLCFASPDDVSAQSILFEDVSQAARIDKVTTSYGGSWGDVNGDGLPDYFANNHARRNSIFVNNGNGTFADLARELDVLGCREDAGSWEDTHGGSAFMTMMAIRIS